MKIAVIITGEMRTFDACLPTLHHHVLRHFRPGGMDFFVATVADKNALKVNLLKERFPECRTEVSTVLEQPDCVAMLRGRGVKLPQEWTRGRFYTHEPYAISVHPQAVARQLWQLEEGWNLFTQRATLTDYAAVIRVRPDLYWQSFTPPAAAIMDALRDAPQVISPWWGRFGGRNDRFAILSLAGGAAADYFRTFSNIPRLDADGVPFHPESLVAASVAPHADVITDALFGTLRENGELRMPEILAADYATLFLRR